MQMQVGNFWYVSGFVSVGGTAQYVTIFCKISTFIVIGLEIALCLCYNGLCKEYAKPELLTT